MTIWYIHSIFKILSKYEKRITAGFYLLSITHNLKIQPFKYVFIIIITLWRHVHILWLHAIHWRVRIPVWISVIKLTCNHQNCAIHIFIIHTPTSMLGRKNEHTKVSYSLIHAKYTSRMHKDNKKRMVLVWFVGWCCHLFHILEKWVCKKILFEMKIDLVVFTSLMGN